MLKVENISSGYGKKQVLFDVSLEVNKGDVVLLTGGNGSGKSTLLKCIYNLLPLWGGVIQFDGKSTKGLKPSELIHKGIVYIPQKDFYFENLTVKENLEISGNILPKAIQKERIEEVLELTGLRGLKKRKPFNLSGGERKVLAFGMALIHKPKLLLFDEPFAGVDRNNSKLLLNLLQQNLIKHDKGIIVVEHNNDDKKNFTQRIKLDIGKTL
jgi:ABC-type branched-subunit amino acid transport system ATPase component